MTEQDWLLAIRDDDSVLCVYADWLEDQGDIKKADLVRQIITYTVVWIGNEYFALFDPKSLLQYCLVVRPDGRVFFSDYSRDVISEPVPGEWQWLMAMSGSRQSKLIPLTMT